ncbi:MAG TPA: HAMP domain-containing sensor histidine kinase [Vicinamibacterales bacterium]|nr:HAMP domain-containing sensor histidine kinase [Vicinamibacterales bacterium]
MITFHERQTRRLFAVAAAIALLLVVLAVLQYRWLGDVSAAERDRMRATLQTRANDFAQAFDGQITRVFTAFHVDPERLDADPAATLAESYARMPVDVAPPGLIKGIFIVNPADADNNAVQRFRPDASRIDSVPMPPELRDWIGRLRRALPSGGSGASPLLIADAVDATLPGLVIAVPHVRRTTTDGQLTVLADPASLARAVVVELDPEQLRQHVLAPLLRKYFGESDYLVTVVRRDDPSHVVYADDPRVTLDDKSADVTAGVFELRLEDVTHAMLPPPRGTAADAKGKLSITIVRRANGIDGRRLFLGTSDNQGAWKLYARYRNDSLDALVASSRRRNFALVLAVLVLLGGSMALIIASADRQRRLAQQQMEFVAAVSHELRTPLAVICSAGENLADGVVRDRDQVKRYGRVVQTEGRRLGDMVERVLLFAGIGAGVRTHAEHDVDVDRVVDDAVGGVSSDAVDRGVTVTVHRTAPLPTVVGDPDALRSALQNVVGNAVKYSTTGGGVDVTTETLHESQVIRIVVSDRGLGIDAADLPHVFKPFYRGRRAIDAQVRGSGIGLSLVLQIVREHGGDVAVESHVGQGTTVTIVLPAKMAADSADGRRRVVLRHRLKQAAARS